VAWRLTSRRRIVMVTSGAFVCLAAAPALGVDAAPSPAGGSHLSAIVAAAPAIVDGGDLSYTVTLVNTGSAAAAHVTVDTRLGGSARSVVDDGTAGSPNSFVGTPLVTVVKLAAGHYRWAYATVRPADVDTVEFTVVVGLPPGATNAAGVAVTNTVSGPGLSTETVTTVVLPVTSAPGTPAGGVGTGTPQTGSSPDVHVAGLLLLGGLGLILAGVLGGGAGVRTDT
jgi:hypothetical protein